MRAAAEAAGGKGGHVPGAVAAAGHPVAAGGGTVPVSLYNMATQQWEVAPAGFSPTPVAGATTHIQSTHLMPMAYPIQPGLAAPVTPPSPEGVPNPLMASSSGGASTTHGLPQATASSSAAASPDADWVLRYNIEQARKEVQTLWTDIDRLRAERQAEAEERERAAATSAQAQWDSWSGWWQKPWSAGWGSSSQDRSGWWQRPEQRPEQRDAEWEEFQQWRASRSGGPPKAPAPKCPAEATSTSYATPTTAAPSQADPSAEAIHREMVQQMELKRKMDEKQTALAKQQAFARPPVPPVPAGTPSAAMQVPAFAQTVAKHPPKSMTSQLPGGIQAGVGAEARRSSTGPIISAGAAPPIPSAAAPKSGPWDDLTVDEPAGGIRWPGQRGGGRPRHDDDQVIKNNGYWMIAANHMLSPAQSFELAAQHGLRPMSYYQQHHAGFSALSEDDQKYTYEQWRWCVLRQLLTLRREPFAIEHPWDEHRRKLLVSWDGRLVHPAEHYPVAVNRLRPNMPCPVRLPGMMDPEAGRRLQPGPGNPRYPGRGQSAVPKAPSSSSSTTTGPSAPYGQRASAATRSRPPPRARQSPGNVSLRGSWPPTGMRVPEELKSFASHVDERTCFVCYQRGHRHSECPWAWCYFYQQLLDQNRHEEIGDIPQKVRDVLDQHMEIFVAGTQIFHMSLHDTCLEGALILEGDLPRDIWHQRRQRRDQRTQGEAAGLPPDDEAEATALLQQTEALLAAAQHALEEHGTGLPPAGDDTEAVFARGDNEDEEIDENETY